MRASSAARLALLALVWGGSFLFIKVAVEGIHPALVAFGRCAVGAAVVVAWAAATRAPMPSETAVWGKLAVMAVLGNVVPFTFIAAAEREITSALASVLNATTPLMTAIASMVLIGRSTMSRRRAIGVAIGFAGVAVIVLPDARIGGGLRGSMMMLVATAAYGLASAYARRFVTLPPVETTAGQLLLAAAATAAVSSLVAVDAPFELTLRRALAMVALGALGTGLGWVIFLRLIADEGANTASLVTYLLPVVSVIMGRLVLGETLRWNAYVGGIVVVSGIAVAERRASTTAAPVAA